MQSQSKGQSKGESQLLRLLTGPLTPAALDECAALLASAAVSPAALSAEERRQVGALLESAGAWIDGWAEQVRHHNSGQISYTA